MAANLPREQRLELMRRAWAMACDGRTQRAIADELGISQPQVSLYLAASRRRISAGLAEEELTCAILSLRQSDRVIDEAFRAFERSTRPRKSATKKTTPTSPAGSTTAGAPGEGTTTTQVVEREGDPAWLATVMAALRLRRELFGWIAPKKADDELAAGTVAAALIEAERRDEAYRCERDQATEPTPAEPS